MTKQQEEKLLEVLDNLVTAAKAATEAVAGLTKIAEVHERRIQLLEEEKST